MMARKDSPLMGLEPHQRLKSLTNYSNSVEVDNNVPPKRYYRTGVEMVRMANTYLKEGSLENAYILYMKFMILFIDKIRKHPDFAQVPAGMKATNQNTLREVLPKTEKLKVQLLEQYTKEYNIFLAEQKKREQEEKEQQLRKDLEMAKSDKSPRQSTDIWQQTVVVQVPKSLDNISYPDDTQSMRTLPDPSSQHQWPSVPTIDRSHKPSSVMSSSVKAGLRTVKIPREVMPKFLLLAQKNTMINVETCGILAGKLEQHCLIITHVIIPKQKGTSDSCSTMNEEEIFDYQDGHNLITIGWIHTHPTQTAFLSSVDLHTQCPYQLLMPEAIAIVCAPKYNETGFYTLTPDYGLDFIANCRQSGFHPHPTSPPLFMTAEHVKIDSSPLEVLDLR